MPVVIFSGAKVRNIYETHKQLSLFFAIFVLRKQNTNTHEYTRIRKNKIHEKFVGHL